MVISLLEEALGLTVRFEQVTVVQSRLSREELNSVLERTSASGSASESATESVAVAQAPPQGGTDGSSQVLSRATLVDTHVVAKSGGGLEVGVRIVGGGTSIDSRRQVPSGDEDLLPVLAVATLDAVSGLMQKCGREVTLRLKEVRRFGRRANDGVVVLVEAVAGGRKTLLSGAAFSANSFQRASVAAVLQSTNALVASVVEFQDADAYAEAGGNEDEAGLDATGAPPVHPRSRKESPGPSAPAAPNDYVSEVLSKLTRGLDRTSPQ
jgi:hypothetical protein